MFAISVLGLGKLRAAAVVLAVAASLAAPSGAAALSAAGLRSALGAQLAPAGPYSGAIVVDVDTGDVLFARRADARRIPASVEKLYTTATALRRLGPDERLRTVVLGTGTHGADGVWRGDLYLKGFGDPTFGSSTYARRNYGGGGNVRELVERLSGQAGIRAVRGSVYGDETFFDRFRGTPDDGLRGSVWVTGRLSALAYNRGLYDARGSSFARRPAVFAAAQLADALRASGVRVSGRAGERAAPADAVELAETRSPSIAELARLTNRPSDNFLAEMLFKGLGARFGKAGSHAQGAAVVRAELFDLAGIRPTVVDGSGLSRANRTSPRELAAFLRAMDADPVADAFKRSLAVAGRHGTLAGRMRGTAAQDRCRAKTGTLDGVSALAGYCRTRQGRELAFAILMNGVNVGRARLRQDRMTSAIAQYRAATPAPAPAPENAPVPAGVR